tara:strand:+ start:924 stop:2141 length:1218 start_codon:yes stop_codon:yes gene_type:complete
MSNNYYSQTSSSTSSQSESSNSNVETKVVIVQAKSSSHPYFGQGSSKGYFIDGKESPSLTLKRNVTYRFDQSDSSNSNHRIQFFTDANKINSYQTNISEVGIAGSMGAYTEITLTSETPIEIFYQCQNHSFMGSNLKSSSTANDTIVSSSYNELIDAGEGTDTVKYSGNFSDYAFKRTSTSLELNDQRSDANGVTSTLLNVEYLQFIDQKVEESKVDVVKTYSGNFSDYKFYNKGNGVYKIKTDSGYDDITGLPLLTFTGELTTSSFKNVSAILDIKATFDQVTGLNTDSGRMFRLYNAAFARFPDADGLEYWIKHFSSGSISDKGVAQSFLISKEFGETYGTNISNATYLENLYVNVLGRDYDQSGYDFWLGELNNGRERNQLLLDFAESPENKELFTEMTGLG